ASALALDLDLVTAGAVPVVRREARPSVGDNGVDSEPAGLPPQAVALVDAQPVEPAGRAGVPGPAAAADVRRPAVDVGCHHVWFDAVVRGGGPLLGALRWVEHPEQLHGAVAVASSGGGPGEPDGAVGVLPTVLAHARWIALDVARVHASVV